MPHVKLHHIISFTSEDQKHKAENLLSGNGMWLCSSNDQSGNIRIEFQIERATAIEYIDIGNHYSAMISIEVGMSSWPLSQNFISLLPTVVLMTPSDCRSGKNSKTVRMFKKVDLDQENVCKKWDRVRVICSQPFSKGTQFGLAFFKLYSQDDSIHANVTADDTNDEKSKHSLISFFASKSKPQKKMSVNLQSLEQSRISSTDLDSPVNCNYVKPMTSTLSRAGKLVMARKHMPNESDAKKQKKDLELEALNFLVSMNLSEEDIHSLRVSHIRTEFEARRNKPLDVREKLIFKNIALDYSAERLRKLEVKEENVCPDDGNQTPGRTPMFNFKRIGNSSKVEEPSGSSPGLSRNSLALVDSVVTNRSGKRKRNESPSFEGLHSVNESSHYFKNKKLNDSGSDDFDGVKCFSVKNLTTVRESWGKLEQRPLDKFGTLNKMRETETSFSREFIECPLCTGLYSCEFIEKHASTCEGKIESDSSPVDQMEECPICENMFTTSQLKSHAEECAERSFS